MDGLGLTHHAGEGRVHGFTSALSVLIPLAAEFVHRGSGIFALKLASLLAGAATITFAFLIARQLSLGAWPTVFLLGYLSFDQNQIFYGMAGMETQTAVAVLLAGLYYLMKGAPIRTGACLGLGLLARPDFVLWTVPSLVYMAWKNRSALPRAIASLVAVAGPWFAFAALYYGSPVPHTIRAKSQVYSFLPETWLNPVGLASWLIDKIQSHIPKFLFYFSPFRECDFIEVPVPDSVFIVFALVVIALAVAGAWRSRQVPAMVVATAYVLCFVAYRIVFLPPAYFVWYLSPFMAFVAILAAAGLDRIREAAPGLSRWLSMGLVLAFASHIPFTFPLDARIQREIEDGVRRPLGEYLHDVALPGEAVVTEHSGYLGYYSRLKLYDFPGLTSPTSYRAIKAAGIEDWTTEYLIHTLRPEWAVLRPFEIASFKKRYPEAFDRYRVVRTFKTDATFSQWGVSMWSIDRVFHLLRRVDILSTLNTPLSCDSRERVILGGLAQIDLAAGQPLTGIETPLSLSPLPEPYVDFVGWAADKDVADVPGFVYLTVDDSARIPAYVGEERSDVVKAFDRPAYRYSGWKAYMDLSGFADGPHTIGLEVISKDGKRCYRIEDRLAVIVKEQHPPAD